MIDLNDLIGLPLDRAIDILKENKFEYKIEEQSSKLETFDTKLVVQLKQDGNMVVLITDSFLLNI